jgi:hypothetical protein
MKHLVFTIFVMIWPIAFELCQFIQCKRTFVKSSTLATEQGIYVLIWFFVSVVLWKSAA